MINIFYIIYDVYKMSHQDIIELIISGVFYIILGVLDLLTLLENSPLGKIKAKLESRNRPGFTKNFLGNLTIWMIGAINSLLFFGLVVILPCLFILLLLLRMFILIIVSPILILAIYTYFYFHLYEEFEWRGNGAKLMFDISSTIQQNESVIIEFLRKKIKEA